jgi:hypothetical protein
MSPQVKMSNPQELEKMAKAVDRIGEYMHTNLVTVMTGLEANDMLSELGQQQAAAMRSMKYADIPEANKEAIRASVRVLLLDVLKDCVGSE